MLNNFHRLFIVYVSFGTAPIAKRSLSLRPKGYANSIYGLPILFAIASASSLTWVLFYPLQELRGMSVDVDALTSPGASNGINATRDTNNGNSGARMLGRTMSGISASLITRTRSAMQSFK